MIALTVPTAASAPTAPEATASQATLLEVEGALMPTFAELLGQGQNETTTSPAVPKFGATKTAPDDKKTAEDMAALLTGIFPPTPWPVPITFQPQPSEWPSETSTPAADQMPTEGANEKISAMSLPTLADMPVVFSAKSLTVTEAVAFTGTNTTLTPSLSVPEKRPLENKVVPQTAGNIVPEPEKIAGAITAVPANAAPAPSAAPGVTVAERTPALVGMTSAMQRPVMSKSALLEKPVAAAKAAPVLIVESPNATKPAVAQRNSEASADRGSKDAALPQPETPISAPEAASGAITLSKPFVAELASHAAPEKVAQTVTATLHQVLETADRMRSDGRTQVELQINLHDGQEVTIKLQMQDGTVQPVFKTESPELRQAIEQSWTGFSTSASDRGLRMTTPVFEAAQAQAGLNNFANRDSRRQARDFAETDSADAQPHARPGLKKSGAGLSLINAPFSRIQRYA